jgi:hypothetical protein
MEALVSTKTYAFLYKYRNQLTEGGLYDIGQIPLEDRKKLDRLVKDGILIKDRQRWMGISNLKTVFYFHPDITGINA